MRWTPASEPWRDLPCKEREARLNLRMRQTTTRIQLRNDAVEL